MVWLVAVTALFTACGSSPTDEEGDSRLASSVAVATNVPTPFAPTTVPYEVSAVPTPTALSLPAAASAASDAEEPAEEDTLVEEASADEDLVEEPESEEAATAEPDTTEAEAAPTQEPAATAVPVATAVVRQTTITEEALAANGGEVYGNMCARCHQPDGLGSSMAKGLLRVPQQYTQASMINELTNGHPVTFGFADKLSAEEIEAVVAYVFATY